MQVMSRVPHERNPAPQPPRPVYSRISGRPRLLSRTVPLALVTAICLAVTGLAISAAPSSQARDVIGDDERDMFIGSGSLILPEGMSRPGRQAAANCPGCAWKATLACDPVSPTACRGQARLCPNDHFWLRISMKLTGGIWQVLGSQCFSPAGPARREAFETSMAASVARAVPPLRPRHRPPTGVLPHLPVIFDSGQPGGDQSWTWSILGMPVRVTAQPSWAWQFTSGAPIATVLEPGGSALNDGVNHVYRAQGHQQVTVRTTWSATYWVGGLGPLTVRQPVHQVAELPVIVGEARAVLRR